MREEEQLYTAPFLAADSPRPFVPSTGPRHEEIGSIWRASLEVGMSPSGVSELKFPAHVFHHHCRNRNHSSSVRLWNVSSSPLAICSEKGVEPTRSTIGTPETRPRGVMDTK